MITLITRRRQKQREDDAWSDGYHTGDDEVEDFIAQKDAFIEKQTGIILGLVAVIESDCPKLFQSMPTHLYEQLRDYA